MKIGISVLRGSGAEVSGNYIEGCEIGIQERDPLHVELGLKANTPYALFVQLLTEADGDSVTLRTLESFADQIGLREWIDTAPNLSEVASAALQLNKKPGTRSLVRAMRSRIPPSDPV